MDTGWRKRPLAAQQLVLGHRRSWVPVFACGETGMTSEFRSGERQAKEIGDGGVISRGRLKTTIFQERI